MSVQKDWSGEWGIEGATVYFLSSKRIGLLAKSGVIFWISFEDRKDLEKTTPKLFEGQNVWVYFAKKNNLVLSVVTKLEDETTQEEGVA